MLLAIVCGGAATWLAYTRVGNEGALQADVDSQQVLVAAFDIEYGATIERSALKMVAWPAQSLPEDILTDFAQAEGEIANQKILRGDPITKRRVVKQQGGSTLAYLIAPEKRAVTVRVNDVIGVGGFLQPGNRVDILATRTLENNRQRVATRTLLQNIKVLAVDQQAQTNQDEPAVVRAVTLEVDPEQGEELVKATEEGTVRLALRNPTDDSQVAKEEKPVVKKPVVRRVYKPRPSEPTVTIIRGTTADTSKVEF